MTAKSNALQLSVICAFFILLAVWGVVWDISSGLLTSGIDGIMLLGVCAMMAGIFFLIMVFQLNQADVLPTPSFLRAKPKAAAAPAPKPAAVTAAPSSAAASPAPAPQAKTAAPAPATAPPTVQEK